MLSLQTAMRDEVLLPCVAGHLKWMMPENGF